jgi:hypothetical protein
VCAVDFEYKSRGFDAKQSDSPLQLVREHEMVFAFDADDTLWQCGSSLALHQGDLLTGDSIHVDQVTADNVRGITPFVIKGSDGQRFTLRLDAIELISHIHNTFPYGEEHVDGCTRSAASGSWLMVCGAVCCCVSWCGLQRTRICVWCL